MDLLMALFLVLAEPGAAFSQVPAIECPVNTQCRNETLNGPNYLIRAQMEGCGAQRQHRHFWISPPDESKYLLVFEEPPTFTGPRTWLATSDTRVRAISEINTPDPDTGIFPLVVGYEIAQYDWDARAQGFALTAATLVSADNRAPWSDDTLFQRLVADGLRPVLWDSC